MIELRAYLELGAELTMFCATRPDLVQIAEITRDNKSLDATNDDDVSVSTSHYVPDPINGYKLEAQKLITKTRAFQAFVFCTLD